MLSKLLRVGEGKIVKQLNKISYDVDILSSEIEKLSSTELRNKTKEFKQRLIKGENMDSLLPEAFAVAREASWRVLSQKHFKVQIMGAAALYFGNVAEMETGEGKTLTAVLPAYLNAVSGLGVHIVTVNDYLAKRDSEWMSRIYQFLGLKTGIILSGMTLEERKIAYASDITYGTNNEFCFDYLRDNMTHTFKDIVQRGHNFAIIDEVDSILIDEARTPLIISGSTNNTSKWYIKSAEIAFLMEKDVHYEVDIKKRTIGIHNLGIDFIEEQLGIHNLYEISNTSLVGCINNAIKAKELFKRDKEYIIRNKEILIIDELIGRVLFGRRYNDGIHQAIEAKENINIKTDNQTLATMTLQNYFRLYKKLSGMTGTAKTEAIELNEIYNLGVVSIPSNKTSIRKDYSDLIYKTEEAKYTAVVNDVYERYKKGQPVLIGTTSVERSEFLSRKFSKKKIPHNILNAKHHIQEANIIAEAGRLGTITIATNMAGRGTDIVLGGNSYFLADKQLYGRYFNSIKTSKENLDIQKTNLTNVKEKLSKEASKVIEVGGLYVLGTERHKSRRIDNQLRGRSGRQGDPGESRFYLSLEDELMYRFNRTNLELILNKINLPDDIPIQSKMVTQAIKNAQTQIEQQNFEIRKNVLKYDEVINQQRKIIYRKRRLLLKSNNTSQWTIKIVVDIIISYINKATISSYSGNWNLINLWKMLNELYPVNINYYDLIHVSSINKYCKLTKDKLLTVLTKDIMLTYVKLKKKIDKTIGKDAMQYLERNVLLQVIDLRWCEHLSEMDSLKEGIGLRAIAQCDPLVEYQKEGYNMFIIMLDAIKKRAIEFLFKISIEQYSTSK